MYVKKLNFVVYLVLALVVGFGTSFLFDNMNVESDQLSGDISKARIYKNAQVKDPETSIVEEKLQNDNTFRYVTQFNMDLLKERVELVGELAQKSVDICSQIPEMENMLISFNSLKAKAHNTLLAIETADEGINKVIDGKDAPEYEIASNNAYIGYQKIVNQMKISKEFVDKATKYVENGGEKSKEMTELIHEWAKYNVQDAMLNDSEEELAYWKKTVSGIDNADLFANSPVANVKYCLVQNQEMFSAINSDRNFVKAVNNDQGLMKALNNDQGLMKALSFNPEFMEALSNNQDLMKALGNDQGLMKALSFNSEFMRALSNDQGLMKALGNDQGLMKALSLNPEFMWALSNDQGLMKALNNNQDLMKALNNNQDLMKALNNNQDLMKALANNQDLMKALSNNQDLMKALGNNQNLMKALSNDQELMKALGNNQDLMKALSFNPEFIGALSNNQGLMKALSNNQGLMKALNNNQDLMKALDNNQDLMKALGNNQDLMKALSNNQGVLNSLNIALY